MTPPNDSSRTKTVRIEFWYLLNPPTMRPVWPPEMPKTISIPASSHQSESPQLAVDDVIDRAHALFVVHQRGVRGALQGRHRRRELRHLAFDRVELETGTRSPAVRPPDGVHGRDAAALQLHREAGMRELPVREVPGRLCAAVAGAVEGAELRTDLRRRLAQLHAAEGASGNEDAAVRQRSRRGDRCSERERGPHKV